MAEASASVLIIQFAREPVPGQVKTRMLPHLSPDEACKLHSDLVLWSCRRLLSSSLAPVQLHVAGDKRHRVFEQCQAMGVSKILEQRGADLGQRMYRAISAALTVHEKVVLVGSDCPGIDADYVGSALRALDRVPLVLGPAEDGGYVLIGATQIDWLLFEGVNWGSAAVLSQTLERLARLDWEFEELDCSRDIDRPEDLPAWEAIRTQTA